MELEFSQQILENIHIKFHDNLVSSSRVVPCGQMDRHMMELIVTLCNFTNVPKEDRK